MPRAAADEPGSTPFLSVRIDRVTPDVVTTTSEPTVTVTGTVRNVGDRPVRDVMVRLEDAAAVTSSAGLRTNLAGNVDQFDPVAEFVTLAPELARGRAVPFTLSYPLRSAEQPSLSIDEPGVYPVMVNVNGTPDYGEPARLDDARFLLPVLGVPRDPATDTADTLTAVVPPDTSKPVGLTMLWPIADRPRLAAGAPGGTTPVRLIDDDLATSLATGGRLDTLLSAVEFATGPQVDPDGHISLLDVPGRRPRPARHRQRDDGRLRGQRRARRRAGHTHHPRRRPGRRGGLAQSAQGAGPADVRHADHVRAGRPRRAAPGRGPRAQRRSPPTARATSSTRFSASHRSAVPA